MQHVAVHLAPSAKPALHAQSTPEERSAALQSWARLLAQLHAVLKPRVALVFFNRAQDALDLTEVLQKRSLRAEVLVSGSGVRAADRLRCIESVLHGSVDFVLATDLAARGLDMRGLSHVVNFDPPLAALDYVHRAGRVERLGGRKGCTVVNLLRDPRQEGWNRADTERQVELAAKVQAALEEQGQGAQGDESVSISLSNPLPRRQGTFSGPSVAHMSKLSAQLHLPVRHVVLESGELHELVTPPKVPRIRTPPTPKKGEAPGAMKLAGPKPQPTPLTGSVAGGGAVAPSRAYSTFVRRLFG